MNNQLMEQVGQAHDLVESLREINSQTAPRTTVHQMQQRIKELEAEAEYQQSDLSRISELESDLRGQLGRSAEKEGKTKQRIAELEAAVSGWETSASPQPRALQYAAWSCLPS